jgi:hypothetical protein
MKDRRQYCIVDFCRRKYICRQCFSNSVPRDLEFRKVARKLCQMAELTYRLLDCWISPLPVRPVRPRGQFSQSWAWKRSDVDCLFIILKQNLSVHECIIFLFSETRTVYRWFETRRLKKRESRKEDQLQITGIRCRYSYCKYQRQITDEA